MSSIVISGDTSGAITLQAPAVAGSTTINLPAESGTLAFGGVTLLGTVAATSGNSVSLTSLDLTPYKFVQIYFNDISCSGTGSLYITSDNTSSGQAQIGTTVAATSYLGEHTVELSSGLNYTWSSIGTVFRTGNIATTSTEIYFKWSAGNFDNASGAFRIYGVK